MMHLKGSVSLCLFRTYLHPCNTQSRYLSSVSSYCNYFMLSLFASYSLRFLSTIRAKLKCVVGIINYTAVSYSSNV
jgi:hypothetical protein